MFHSLLVCGDNLHYEKFADGSVKCIEDEIPFDLPDGWAWARLTSICLKITDGTHHSPDSFPTGEYKYVTAKNIKLNGIVLDDITYVTAEVHREIFARCNPEIGDILYIKDGATSGIATVNTLHEEFSLLSSVALLKPAHGIDNWYMCYAMQSPYFYSTTRGDMKGVGITRITLNMLASRLIPVPPQNEQQRISVKSREQIDLISSIESDKGNIVRMVSQAKSKILDLAIRGQLVPQDPADEPASVLLERIRAEKEDLIRKGKIKRDKKESVIFRGEDNSYYVRQGTHTESIDEQFIFELPDSWEWCSLLNIAKIELGKTLDSAKNTGTNYPYLRSVNVRWNEVDLLDLKEMRFEPEELERYTVRRHDLLICEGGDVGRSCVWTDEKEILYQNALHRVRFYGECNPFYFMYYMMYYESRGIIKALCKGVTIKHLTGNVLSLIPFALPPLEEQGRIVERLNQIFALLDSILCD